MAAAWAPPAGDADWSPPAGDADAVPAAPAASAGASDYANPTAAAEPDSADPATLYRQYHTYGAQSPEELNEFMRRYKEDPSSIGDARKAKTAGYVASMLTGLPRAAAGVALAVPAAVAGGAGALTGTLGALADTGLGRPDRAGEDLEAGRERLRSWSAATYGLANYVPATQAGAAYASQLLAVPSQIGSAVNQGIVKPVLGDNAAQAVGDIAQDIGTELPAFGAPGLVRAGVKGAAALGRGVRGALTTPEPAEGTTYDAAGNAVAPSRGLTPPVGQPVTGATLRASPNPIPPPEGTVAAAKQPPPVTEVGIKTSTGPTPIPDNITPPTEPAAPSAASPTQAPTQETTARPAPAAAAGAPPETGDATQSAGGLSMSLTRPDGTVVQGTASRGPTAAAGDAALSRGAEPTAVLAVSRAVRAGEITADEGNARLAKMGAAQTPATRVSGPKNQRGSVRVMNSPGEESAFDAMGRIIPGASLFTSPKDEGPQETPNPAEQGERAANLDAIDKLSSGGLPSRRASAISGDYNATGDDWQLKETGSKTMQAQLASENAALHAATDNVHNSVGSEFGDSVDPTTMENRADVTRGAIQAIEKHFDGMTDELYDNARAVHGDTPMPQFLTRANSFLGDDANYMPDGFRKAAQARLQQLRTVGDAGIKGDGTDAAAPSSVGAAEKFREWLNQNRTLDNMHTTRQLVNHTDMDVAQSGGPGLFQAARNMKTYSYQMLEEPTGIRKLLAPGDSQGINHAIKRHEVMDYIANLDGPQHEHVLNVLRAGAHLTPELAESSAAAIREIQAHTVSRLHDAATDDGGKWNARGFYNAASRYGRNAASTFADRPDIVRNLKTINDAGNTLHMDRHYPGAAAQAVRSGALAAAAAVGGKALASVAHEIPLAGRMVGRAIENATEKATGEMADTAREKMATSRLVDRNGKQRGSVRVMNAPGEEGALDILGRNPVVQAAGQLAPKKEDQINVPDSQRGSVRVMNFDHYSNLNDEKVTLDPKFYGTGMRGAEARRGGTKTVSLYPEGASPEGDLGSKTKYKVSVPASKMYDMSRDPEGLRAGAPSFSDAEDAVKEAGYAGYHTPTHSDPLFRGQGRLLVPTAAVRADRVKGPASQRGSVKVMNDEAPSDEHVRYHTVESAHREDILKNGLNPKNYSRKGVYVSAGTGWEPPETHDTWKVNTKGLKVEPDTMGQTPDKELGTPWSVIRQRVGPERLQLLDKQRGSVKVMNEPAPEEGNGSMLNVGLHQGTQGEPGFRKMSKQEAQAAVESTGAKVTKNSVLTPDRHGVSEPTAVMSTNRPLSNEEMQSVLAKTKQTAIPQRADNGDESMHVAPGHEQTAKEQGWDSFNPEYFREHDGRTMTDTAANPKNIHPDTTVTNPKRSAFPGVYDDPEEIMQRLGEGKPESPHLKEIFGKTRKDLHDDAVARGDVEPKTPIPGIAPKGKGSAHASDITNDANAERIRNIIQAYKEHDPSGYHGMVGWYEMDPMYQSIKKILGGSDDAASKVYHNLNSMTSYASPMSPVVTEIRRGTAAAMMAAEGNFDKFAKYGNLPQKKAPAALKAKNFELGNEGTMAHGSQAPAMGRFLETGQEANAVKTGTYRRSSDAPSRTGSDYQNTQPVGDSHWSRGVGLADVRGAKAFEGSADGPEMKTLGKWFHDEVARHPDIDLPSTSAQAVQWAALSKETGVDSPVGAPKLEIWADKIATAAKREGIAPRAMWERIVKRLAK